MLVLLLYGLCALRLGMWAGAVAATLIAISLLLHEVGHLVGAACFGVRVHAIGVALLGPYIRRDPAQSPTVEVVISLLGPAVNFFLALLLSGAAHPLLRFVAIVNACLVLTNVIPRSRSDGLRAWNALTKHGETPAD